MLHFNGLFLSVCMRFTALKCNKVFHRNKKKMFGLWRRKSAGWFLDLCKEKAFIQISQKTVPTEWRSTPAAQTAPARLLQTLPFVAARWRRHRRSCLSLANQRNLQPWGKEAWEETKKGERPNSFQLSKTNFTVGSKQRVSSDTKRFLP